ncbi:MAG: hypothetical protein QOD75_1612 [Blastocatellia bacterium]|jgi:Gpi18-like mannosyltransferase|nr:hypothetical protein [Blastocatellia bacterium]
MKSPPETSNPQEVRPRFGLRSGDWRIVAMIAAIKLLLFFYATRAYQLLEGKPLSGWFGWLEIWNRWDAVNYLKLAELGYSSTGETRTLLGFYPLYPWLIRVLALGSNRYLISAVVITTIAAFAAGILFRRLLLLDYPEQLAERAVCLLFIFPTSYFLHIGYTESLFLVMVFGAFLAARSARWWIAGVLGALSCVTRAQGPLLVPALAIEAFLEYRQAGRWRWQWLWIGFVGVGLLGYLLLNRHVAGDAFAFLAIRRQYFFSSPAWPWLGIGSKIAAMNLSSSEGEVVANQEVFFILLGLVCSIVSWLKLRASYAAWITLNWLMATSLAFVLGVPRYTVCMFPIFILFAQLTSRFIWRVIIAVWSLMFLGLFAAQFVRGRWAF